MILSSKKLVLAACLLSVILPVSASCLGSGDAEIEALAKDIGRQPHQALQAIEQALAPDRTFTLERRAWLEAARAQAKRMLGLRKTELAQAVEDAKTLPADHPALLHLQIAQLYGFEPTPANREMLDTLKYKLGQQPANQPAVLCLKIRLASVMAGLDQLNGETFELASDAYRHADTEPLAWMRAEAASVLGQVVLRTDGNYARILSEEALRYFESQNMHDMVANEWFMSAMAWAGQRDRKSLQIAADQFRRSKEVAKLAGNTFAAAYAEAGLCGVLVDLNNVKEAVDSCSASLEQIKGTGDFTEYSTTIYHAAALLADNRPTETIELLVALSRDWPGWDVGYYGYRLYEVRGRAYRELGKTEDAISDFITAMHQLREYESNNKARTNRLIQSRFRVDQLEQNLELKTQETKERERRNRILLFAALIVLVLLCAIVLILIRHRRLYRDMAFTDPLTGLANRRYTLVRAQEAFEHAKARQQQLFIALIDLDRFKSCNDRYGHDAGDEALQQFARVAGTVLRPGDLLGRWGGEEFLLVLQGIDKDSAAKVMERLHGVTAKVRLTLAPEYPLQFSAGVVELRGENASIEELVMLADKALYRAKEAGRNRSCFAPLSVADAPQPSA